MNNLTVNQQIDNTEYTEMTLHIIAYSILIVITSIGSIGFLKELLTTKHKLSFWYQEKTLSSFLAVGTVLVSSLLLTNTIIHWKNLKKISKSIHDKDPYSDPKLKPKLTL